MVVPPLETKRDGDDGSKYEILRVVNRGGMGEIALARVRGAKGFEKLVVLKRLREDAEREDHQQMFDVEAELMSRIEHPNIVQVFDQPRIGGIQYLAMAYIQGRNLDQVVRKCRQDNEHVSLQFALTVTSEVLRGLAFVHRLKDSQGRALGVVHQDITPSNILVSFYGEVKITDFGIAYVTSRDGGKRKGVLKGKPRYVAPEVLAGKRVNNRADLYGVSVVLYELLALKPLFARPSPQETLTAVARNDLPDFSKTLARTGDGLHRILERALRKDPQDRYRTAEEMHADVAIELAKLGGPMSSAHMGFWVRNRFQGAPDVPDVDPSLDASLVEARPTLGGQFRAPNLDQTISELDRLLGGDSSTSADVFALPPDLVHELDSLVDMDPFAALTPIPELALEGPNAEEDLMRSIMHDPLQLERDPLEDPTAIETRPPSVTPFERPSRSHAPSVKTISELPSFPLAPTLPPAAAKSDGAPAGKVSSLPGRVSVISSPELESTNDPFSRTLSGRRRARHGASGEYTLTPARKTRGPDVPDSKSPPPDQIQKFSTIPAHAEASDYDEVTPPGAEADDEFAFREEKTAPPIASKSVEEQLEEEFRDEETLRQPSIDLARPSLEVPSANKFWPGFWAGLVSGAILSAIAVYAALS